MKNCIIASTSTVHGSTYLEYIKNELIALYKDVNHILFIPYARPGGISQDAYTKIARTWFSKIDIKVTGIHEYDSIKTAFDETDGIFTGGGNTFLLVDQLYRNKVVDSLRSRILEGVPYLGTSAGSNICGLTMQTTNDMPIVYPPSFKTLGILPFNINPHYLDPDLTSKHKGETRETRIKEFHAINTPPVIGLREGSWLQLKDNEILLKGNLSARIFEKNKAPYEMNPETSLLTIF
ncbi:dipeptidase PepE [Aquimarina sp. W85]|uniref:dipeptidase PepE n=1 Tax=Aquimarina rhodophyticola TaxID=3342246 RepID=UPI00366CD7C9